MVLRVRKFENGIFHIFKGIHSHMVFLNTPLHVDTVTDMSKLPWHKYLKANSPKINILSNLLPHCLQL
jgi:hypothetical protein